MKRLRVGVFMGGRSVEKEVSFNSGRTICDHLDTHRFEIIPIFQSHSGLLYILPWRFLHRGKISDFIARIPYEATQITWEELKNIVDFIYLAIHGRYAEDGTIQGILEILKIPYLGSKVFSSALVMDKIIQRDFLKLHNINIPNAAVITVDEILNFEKYKFEIEDKINKANLKLPFVVKPHKEGSSLGITIVNNKNELLKALEIACFIHADKSQPVLIEEKIEGMEFTCIIVIDKKTRKPLPLSVTEIVTEKGTDFFDYQQKYMPGRATKITPARCSKEILRKIKDECIKVMQILEIKTIARIDGFLTKDNNVVIMDPNTLSGMAPSSFLFRQAAEIGWNHTQLINHLIEEDLKYYGLDKSIEIKESNKKTMNKEKIKVAILIGGNSNEKEISLESGRNIVYKLSPEKYQAIPIFITSNMEFYAISQQLLVRNSTKEIEDGLDTQTKIEFSDLPRIADFIFIALHGGVGENGCMQGALEMLDLPYNGSGVFSSALCMDKYKTNQFLQFKGFDVPKNLLISKNNWQKNKEKIINEIYESINFPLILKPHDDGCSIMVYKIINQEELINKIEIIFTTKDNVLIEEFISGTELTIGVIGNNYPVALIPSQSIALKDVLSIEEKFLPGQGENQTPAQISKEAENLARAVAVSAYKSIGCKGYARIDCFYQNSKQSPSKKDRIVIIEFNTLPAMTPATCLFHQAAEMNIKPMDFIDLIVTLGFEEHQIKKPVIKNLDNLSQIITKLNLNKYNIMEL